VQVDGAVGKASRLIEHVSHVMLLTWRRMVRLGFALGVIGFFCAEVVSILATRRFPPPLMAHAVALIFGLVLGYCAALTVIIDELLRGVREALGLVEGEGVTGMRAIARIAQTESSHLEAVVGSTLRTERGGGPASATASSVSHVADASAADVADEDVDALAATDAFARRLPATDDSATPVPADRLPRIPAFGEDHPPAAALGPMPPLQSLSGSGRAADAPELTIPPLPAPHNQRISSADDFAGSTQPMPATPAVSSSAQAGNGKTSTSPVARSMWSRISDTLVGRTPSGSFSQGATSVADGEHPVPRDRQSR